MKHDKKTLVAYAAGYFDGEGCISTKSGKKRPVRYWTPILAIVSRGSIESVQLMESLFGGKVSQWYTKRDEKMFYHWQLQNSAGIKRCLKLMLPFLKIKKKQAELTIRICERILVGVKNKKGRGNRLSENEVEKRQELTNKVRELNHLVPEELLRAETKRRDIDNNKNSMK